MQYVHMKRNHKKKCVKNLLIKCLFNWMFEKLFVLSISALLQQFYSFEIGIRRLKKIQIRKRNSGKFIKQYACEINIFLCFIYKYERLKRICMLTNSYQCYKYHTHKQLQSSKTERQCLKSIRSRVEIISLKVFFAFQ